MLYFQMQINRHMCEYFTDLWTQRGTGCMASLFFSYLKTCEGIHMLLDMQDYVRTAGGSLTFSLISSTQLRTRRKETYI